jgi:hypothetical protein
VALLRPPDNCLLRGEADAAYPRSVAPFAGGHGFGDRVDTELAKEFIFS